MWKYTIVARYVYIRMNTPMPNRYFDLKNNVMPAKGLPPMARRKF